ncbi:MAG: hypothetical protein PHS86_00465 [Syntrophaceae bacterium]|nr:hypothetical protein [Syntrophaceae bacterium]
MDDQKILSSDDGFGAVTVCPGGVVHVNLLHFTLKFLPNEFERFSDLIAKARMNQGRPKKPEHRPKLQVVSTDPKDEPEE